MPDPKIIHHKILATKVTRIGDLKSGALDALKNASGTAVTDKEVLTIQQAQQKAAENTLAGHMAILQNSGADGLDSLGHANFSGKVSPSAGVFVPSLLKGRAGDIKVDSKYGKAQSELRKMASKPIQMRAKKINNKTGTLKKIRSDSKLEILPALPISATSVPGAAKWFMNVMNIDVAYIFANTLSFSAYTDLVINSNISKVIIIANQIQTSTTSVSITWNPPAYEAAPAHQNMAGASTGSNGKNGAQGGRGSAGKSAPDVEIWTPNPIKDPSGNVVTDPLTINLSGQDGDKGAAGQNGQKGGRGHRGADSVPGRGPFCKAGPQRGDTGKRGGNGGLGGDGGNGGNGGHCKIYAGDVLDFSNTLFISDKGEGGAGGAGGNRGAGGPGGYMGAVRGGCANWPNDWSNREHSPSGPAGQNGQPGIKGQDGTIGSLTLMQINPVLFTQLTSSVAVTTLSKYKAKVGETITIHGLRIETSDKIIWDGNQSDPKTPIGTTAGAIGFHAAEVPPLEGGPVSVAVRDAGYTSNSLDVHILPHLTSLSHQRIKPGDDVTLTGTGFSAGCRVLINGQPATAFSFLSSTEMKVTAERPTNVMPNPDGETVTLSIIDAENNRTNELSIVLDTTRILVFGDSVFAVQGVDESNMFPTLIRDWMQSQTPEIGVYSTHLAHSGAVLEDGNGDGWHPIVDKEIPSKTPSINAQFDHATNPMAQVASDSVDYIIMNGGHNDMGEAAYLTPEVNPSAHNSRLQLITDMAYEGSYVRLKRFLLKANAKCPNAKIIVCGYYQVVSDQSAGFFDLTKFIATVLGTGLGVIASQVAYNSVVAQSAHAVQEINRNMQQAIQEANAEIGSNKIVFVDVGFNESNAIFAPNSMIWEFDNFGQTEDPLTARRRDVCGGDFICEMASTGHPNMAGNQRYFERIRDAL